MTTQPERARRGLILTGGGARAAYQVGVLKGIAELLPRGAPCPFPVITGTSAGAVSAVALAADAAHFRRAVLSIERVWREFRVHQVFKADAASMLRSGAHWMLALLTGGWLVRPPQSLFDNGPLWDLLRGQLDFDGIPRGIYKGHLQAIGISATSYGDACSTTFFAGAPALEPWRRAAREGVRAQLTLEHVMASLAIPFVFRPVLVAGRHFGDGAMRQTSPLSPAFHFGASRLLIIGTGAPQGPPRAPSPAPGAPQEPTFAQMVGFMLDSLFMDEVYSDLERINSFNAYSGRRQIEPLVIAPSQDLTKIALQHARELPRSLRILMRTLGANSGSGTHLLSYLLFERGFTRELIALGLADARASSQELRRFLDLDPTLDPAQPQVGSPGEAS